MGRAHVVVIVKAMTQLVKRKEKTNNGNAAGPFQSTAESQGGTHGGCQVAQHQRQDLRRQLRRYVGAQLGAARPVCEEIDAGFK